MKQSLDELDGVFTYLVVTEDALGVAKDEMAAKPLVLYESRRPGGARLRGGRHPRGHRPRDRHRTTPTRARCWCGPVVESADQLRRPRAGRARRAGAADDHRDRRATARPGGLRRAELSDPADQPRAALAGVRARESPTSRSGNPGAKHSHRRSASWHALHDHASRAASATSAAA